MCHHAGFQVGELAGGEINRGSGVSRALGIESCSLHFPNFCIFFLSVLLLLLFALFAVSIKLPLSRPTSFCLFLSILLPTLVGGGVIEGQCGPLLLATAKLQHLHFLSSAFQEYKNPYFLLHPSEKWCVKKCSSERGLLKLSWLLVTRGQSWIHLSARSQLQDQV